MTLDQSLPNALVRLLIYFLYITYMYIELLLINAHFFLMVILFFFLNQWKETPYLNGEDLPGVRTVRCWHVLTGWSCVQKHYMGYFFLSFPPSLPPSLSPSHPSITSFLPSFLFCPFLACTTFFSFPLLPVLCLILSLFQSDFCFTFFTMSVFLFTSLFLSTVCISFFLCFSLYLRVVRLVGVEEKFTLSKSFSNMLSLFSTPCFISVLVMCLFLTLLGNSSSTLLK